MAPESIMPPGPAEQPAKPQCSTQPNIFTPTTAPHGAQGLRLRRRSVAGLANLKNNSSAAEPLRIAGFAGSICGRMSTPGHAVTGPQSPPNHILKAMARYRVSQSEEGVSAPLALGHHAIGAPPRPSAGQRCARAEPSVTGVGRRRNSTRAFQLYNWQRIKHAVRVSC